MSAPLLEVREVSKTFAAHRRGRGGRGSVRAVDRVSFELERGRSIGIAGESGSGKSTLARMILRLEEPTDGAIRFDGVDYARAGRRQLLGYRRQVQAVFQDSASALSPRMRIRDIVAEPLEVQQPQLGRATIDHRVDDCLQRVGLSPELRDRYPHQLSGGQKQRVAIARALIVDPRMLVLDEPVSALDVSVRSQVLNLLLDLQEARQLAYVMIAHDLAVLKQVTSELIVMYRGQVVERGATEDLLREPVHSYTRALVDAVPRLKPDSPGALP